ncbi:replication-associated recombination protein A [Candidatus Acetothermia bacterium]|jgi:putative ATPase|nr:replication-associated recombination protein A [Candidatus Acetothermia bacterium]MCI2431587.1 replication-associated recombination protein A [Candidatus Acetothermia bacterium]MCI2436295.1 replication-associated recombination protein A [Candidatus Acetothermia bacterium]
MSRLFSKSVKKQRPPLAERMRPQNLDEFVGQEELVGPEKPLRKMLEQNEIRSLVLWGPPGTGKTTLGWIIARSCGADFLAFSATRSSIKEIQSAMERSKRKFQNYGTRDLIFVDELHRFNKAQQAAFLPYVEEGSIILIGATTENPSFEIIAPLLSRSQVFVLQPLSSEQIKIILRRALTERERGLGTKNLELAREAEEFIAQYSDGDARRALNLLELAAETTKECIDLKTVQDVAQRKLPIYDKSGEEHYNLISALHKSVRNSDPDAALYWLARMLAGGEDPLYIARRLIRMAIEDIGLADPQALSVAVAAKDAYDFLGLPEGELALAETVIYLATAPKSNSVYLAFGEVREAVETTRNEPVPLHLRNPVTKLMKEVGYGEGYQYAHSLPEGIAPMECLPESLQGKRYYQPREAGYEKEIKRRLERWRELKKL